MSTASSNLIGLLENLDGQALAFQRGIEREGLRVDTEGNLSRQPHPEVFGSKLFHPLITTDFSEAQLELITPVDSDIGKTFETLAQIHQVVNRGMGDEILWAASMPCVLQGDPNIPLADYGESNLGKLKRTYRMGLGNRYGRSMQTICAVHYNFSFSDAFWQALAAAEGETDHQTYRNRRYFDLIRNFRRFSWLPIYLFGASPAVCNSFVRGRDHQLEAFDEGSLHLPYATSLRSGNLGYQSDAQAEQLNVGYNSVEEYVSTLAAGVTTSYGEYAALGIKDQDKYLQLNDCILQSEAEFYSTIRAKRVAPSGANFLQHLRDEGVEYIEVRLMDLDPFEPMGIGVDTVRFLDAFLLYCLLTPSPSHDEAQARSVTENLSVAVKEGRKPGVLLEDGARQIALTDWAQEILTDMTRVTEHLDQVHNTSEYSASLKQQQAKVVDADQTPSARILKAMKDENIPFFRFAMNQSLAHKETHLKAELATEVETRFTKLAADSLTQHGELKSNSEAEFDQYLADILSSYPDLAV